MAMSLRSHSFADDTTLILDGSKNTLLAAFNVLEVYGNMSGLRVNMDKTKLVWIGKKRNSKGKFDMGKELAWGASNSCLWFNSHISKKLSIFPRLAKQGI